MMKDKQIAFTNRMQNDQPRLCMELISDLHVKGFTQDNALQQALEDMWDRRIRHVMIAGDLTNNGYTMQLKRALSQLKEFPIHYACALGNHDLYNIFHKHQVHIHPLYKELMLQEQKQLYYRCMFQNYSIYVLNSEKPMKDMTYFSDQQFTWLHTQLAKEKKDKPIFILCHHPLMNTHPKTETMLNTIGAQNNKVYQILKQFPNIIYISGHIHNSYTSDNVIIKDSMTFLNIPAFRMIQHGEDHTFVGYHLAVYHDFIHIRTRDYKTQKWILSHEFIIDLTHQCILPFISS